MHSNHHDDALLRELLAAWTIPPSAPPDFAAAVWRRIAKKSEPSVVETWRRIVGWCVVDLPKPAFAAGALAASVMLGVVGANVHAGQVRDQYRMDNARQYLASIDPISMADHDGPHALR